MHRIVQYVIYVASAELEVLIMEAIDLYTRYCDSINNTNPSYVEK